MHFHKLQTFPHTAHDRAIYQQSPLIQRLPETKTMEEIRIPSPEQEPKSFRHAVLNAVQGHSCSPLIDKIQQDYGAPRHRSSSAFQRSNNQIHIVQAGKPVEWAFQDEKLPKFPTDTKSLRILVLTWNLHGKKPKEGVETLLNMNRVKHHVISIGTEECLRSIQASTIKKSKSKWIELLRRHLDEEYIMIRSHAMNALHLTVFVHRSIFGYVRDIDSSEVRTGFKNMMGNKGGIGISVKIYDASFLFINCHLASGQNHVKQRNEDFERILNELDLPRTDENKIKDRINRMRYRFTTKDQFDFIFWSGDFNYRVDETRGNAVDYLKANNFHVLLKEDQLANERKANKLLNDFEEGEITFPPTYKYQVDSHYFAPACFDNTKKKKIPSWTDRILFRCRDPNKTEIKQLNYQSIQSVTTSDHRPVFSQFIVTLADNNRDTERRFWPAKENVCNIF